MIGVHYVSSYLYVGSTNLPFLVTLTIVNRIAQQDRNVGKGGKAEHGKTEKRSTETQERSEGGANGSVAPFFKNLKML